MGNNFKQGEIYFCGDIVAKEKRKMPHVDTDEVERKEKPEIETMDIYKEKEREQMLEDDEITATEGAFMAGREMKVGKKKKDLMLEERDTESVELAEEDYRDD